MSLGRRTEDVSLVAHGRNLAGWLAALALGACATPSAANILHDVPATLALDAIGFPPITISAPIPVEVGPPSEGPGLVGSLLLGPRLFGATSAQSVAATAPPPAALSGVFDNDAGGFERSGGGPFGGVMPLTGALRVCLFGDCSSAPAQPAVPLSVVGQHRTVFASDAAVQLTVVGAPWTTGTVAVGAESVRGSHVEQPLPTNGDVVSWPAWFRTNLVTPVFISTNQASYTISAVGRLEIQRWEPACADGVDDDGDGAADFPADAGCASPDDLFEGSLDFADGARHQVDAPLAAGKSVLVYGPPSASTRLRIAEPAAVDGDVDVRAGGVLQMDGGTIAGALRVYAGEAVVSGGSVDTLGVFYGTILLRGTGFDRPYGPIAETSGRVTGTLADGSALDAAFDRAELAQLVLPEPAQSGAMLAVGLALALLRRARRRASARSS